MSEPKFSVGEEVIYVGAETTVSSSTNASAIGLPLPYRYGDKLIILDIGYVFGSLHYCIYREQGQSYWEEAYRLRKLPPKPQPADADWQEDFNRMLNPKRVHSKQTKAVGDE